MYCDQQRQANAENDGRDQEVGVGDYGFGSLRFVHGVTSIALLMIDEACGKVPVSAHPNRKRRG